MKADLAVRTPVENAFEETRLDPAHGGSAFWDLFSRLFGVAFDVFCFRSGAEVLRKQYLPENISAGRLQVAAVFLFFLKIKNLCYKITCFWSPQPSWEPKTTKIGPKIPPGDPQMVKIESQRAPQGAHEIPKDPRRAPKGPT